MDVNYILIESSIQSFNNSFTAKAIILECVILITFFLNKKIATKCKKKLYLKLTTTCLLRITFIVSVI